MSTEKYNPPLDGHVFEVAIFCALSFEADPIIALFDDRWEDGGQFAKAAGDTNNYTIGRMGQHYVVLAHLPYIGKAPAANAAANLRFTFPRIRLGLLVGVCGGVPFFYDQDHDQGTKREVILGDIIISKQITQADFGRQYSDGFVPKTGRLDNHGRPTYQINGFLSKLNGKMAQEELQKDIQMNLETLYDSGNFDRSKYPGALEDQLFDASYRHKHHDNLKCTICAQCEDDGCSVCSKALHLPCAELGCDARSSVSRVRIQQRIRENGSASYYLPMVYFGAFSSGDQVIKSAPHRDSIAKHENVIGFEMEGVGLCDTIPTIVVKGVCDYADSHKNKVWQPYAASIAAACAKGVIKAWTATTAPAQERHHQAAPFQSQVQQTFNGSFNARNIYNGVKFTAQSMNF